MSSDLDLLQVDQSKKMQTHIWTHDFDLHVDQRNKMQTHVRPPI